MKTLSLFFTCLLLFFQLSCKEDVADSPVGNQPPRTFLWLYPDSTIGLSVSRQHLHWWAEDPDGAVVGYLFTYAIFPNRVSTIPNPDTLRYTWVTKNDTLILFPLDTLIRDFTVIVRGVDNSFGGLPNQSIVRFTPRPFWDRDDDGLLDAGDQELPQLSGATDPVGSVQTFPIRNTPPTIAFAPNPNDETLALKQPDSTFTAATFAFKATDADGDITLVSYRIALNDTSSPSRWLTVPLRDTMITLVVPRTRSDGAAGEVVADVYGGQFLGRRLLGQLQGLRLDALNVLYVQAKDAAGEFSPTIRMPSGADHWYVKRPRGKLLIVSDDVSYGIVADTIYRNALSRVPGGEFTIVDKLNIALGLTANDKLSYRLGRLMPPFQDPALIYTFLLYDYVFWYTEQYPTLGAAQASLFAYVQNGGKLLFSTTFLNTVDPRGALRDFAPIDSVSSVDLAGSGPPLGPPRIGDTRLPANLRVLPDSSVPTNIYPQLAFNSFPSIHTPVYMRPIYRRSDARYIYRLESDPRSPLRYTGAPNVAVVDGAGTNIFIGLPLHLLNNSDPTYGNPDALTAFFTKIFTQEFSPNQKVNRRKF